jgi:hypothetical protein
MLAGRLTTQEPLCLRGALPPYRYRLYGLLLLQLAGCHVVDRSTVGSGGLQGAKLARLGRSR